MTVQASDDGRKWFDIDRIPMRAHDGWIKPQDGNHVLRCRGSRMYRCEFEVGKAYTPTPAFSGIDGDDISFSVRAPAEFAYPKGFALNAIECDVGAVPRLPLPASMYHVYGVI